MASPNIRAADQAKVVALIRSCAPEKGVQLDKLIAQLKPIFLLDVSNSEVLFCSDSDSRTVTIGVECTKRLEAHAAAAAIFFSSGRVLPDQRRPFLDRAMLILRWVVTRDLHLPLQRQGLDIPLERLEAILAGTPDAGVEVKLPEMTEDERFLRRVFFLMSVTFVLLHELAHIRRRDVGCKGEKSLQQERDADHFAADWLMDGCPSAERPARLMGIAIALMWRTVLNVFLGPSAGRTHPNAYDRLYQTLDRLIDGTDDADEVIWDMVLRTLLVHAQAGGLEVDSLPEQPTRKEAVSAVIDVISKQKRPTRN